MEGPVGEPVQSVSPSSCAGPHARQWHTPASASVRSRRARGCGSGRDHRARLQPILARLDGIFPLRKLRPSSESRVRESRMHSSMRRPEATKPVGYSRAAPGASRRPHHSRRSALGVRRVSVCWRLSGCGKTVGLGCFGCWWWAVLVACRGWVDLGCGLCCRCRGLVGLAVCRSDRRVGGVGAGLALVGRVWRCRVNDARLSRARRFVSCRFDWVGRG
jgi:hypothetical protein